MGLIARPDLTSIASAIEAAPIQQATIASPISLQQPLAAVDVAATTTGADFAAAVEQRATEIAERLLRERLEALRRVNTGRVFTRFDPLSDVVENQKQIVTAGIWSGGIGTLEYFYTSSTAAAEQKKYYYDVYNSQSLQPTAEVQFAVAYGHRLGSGSATEGQINDAPTRAIYSQYRLLLLEPGDEIFTFANSQNSDHIYVVNFNRARIKERLDPGNWQLHLATLSGSFYANNIHTGSNVQVADTARVIKLIDDSGDSTELLSTLGQSGRRHNVVSGTIEEGIYKVGGKPVYYGLSFPDMGCIILNADVLNLSASFNTVTGSDVAGDNAYKLFASISGAAEIGLPLSNDNFGFRARNAETITSTHYFVRVKNAEYNFSNNPTFSTGAVGEFKQPTFINDPKVYITTVGMYNDRQELLAVAKLSKPILKSFSNEVVIKVKLDF